MVASPPPELAELLDITLAYQRSQAVAVAAELGVADLLRDGPCSVDELAAGTGAHSPALYRLLRALAAIGVVHEDEQRRFRLTAIGEYLRRDHPLSVDPVARMYCADYEWRAWGELLHGVRTGESPAHRALGTDVWEYRRRHRDQSRVFDAAMRTLSRMIAAGLLEVYSFDHHRLVADIGGGTGAVLAAVLARYPHLEGILFDQPHVVGDAGPVLGAAGVQNRVTVVPGDFFTGVPSGADVYLMVRVLHDWLDDDAARILDQVRSAMRGDALLLILDAVVGPPNEDAESKFFDLMMLVSAGGRERELREWEALLAGSGLQLVRATPTTPTCHVIESVPV